MGIYTADGHIRTTTVAGTNWTGMYADPVLPWITGAWNNTNNTSSLNSTMFISADGVHPPDVGTDYLSQRIAQAFRQNVLSVVS